MGRDRPRWACPRRLFPPLAVLAALLVVATTLRASSYRRGSDERDAKNAWLEAVPGNLEGRWRFKIDPDVVGEKQGWHLPAHDDRDWRTLRVPGNWEAQGVTDTRPGMPPKPRGNLPWTDYDGTAWYRKHLHIPQTWAGKPLLLQLGSVDDADRTYFNGTLVGATPISTVRAVLVQRLYRVPADLVRPGAENVIAVEVTDGGGPGGLMGPILTLLPEEILSKKSRLPDANRPLEPRFADPPAESRILKIIHNWPDDPPSQDLLIQTLMAQGFGGVVCNVSFDQYLRSEAHWASFVRAVQEARKAGMSLWLYDEKGYPSGTAGGLTLEGHPEWEARGLLIADAITAGSPVTLDIPPGRLLLAAAYPLRRDGALDPQRAVPLKPDDGRLVWTPPGGRWYVLMMTEDRIYEGTHAANSLADRLPYINLLLSEPTARFLDLTHGAYARRLGNDLGKYFVSTFTDEPSLMSLFLRRMPYRVLPWSQSFAAEFRSRRGYDLLPRLALLCYGDGSMAMKTRYDFWKTVSELVSDRYFGQIQRWCAAHNLRSGGHLLLEENLSHHVPLYGDFFACVRRLDAPSIDCLTSVPPEVPWHIAKMMGSVADLEGRTVTMCETSDFVQVYRPQGDTRPVRTVTEEEIRGTCNRLILGGIHTITSYYTFRDLSTDQLQRLNAYVGRCTTMLAGGHQVTDIAVVYPVESAWIGFRPSHHMTADSPDTLRIERCFRNVSEVLYASRRDFTYVDSKALRDARVEKGQLVHGRLRWRVVVLPHVTTLPREVWQKLERFVAGGGVLIALGRVPQNSDTDFPSPAVEAMARRLFGAGDALRSTKVGAGGLAIFVPEGSEAMLGAVLDGILEHDVTVANPAAPLRLTHRRVGRHHVYFLINDSPAPWKGEVALCANGVGEIWNPLSGSRTRVASPEHVPVALEPYAGVFLRFPSARPRRLSGSSGGLPSMTRRRLQPGVVSQGGGEFVQGTVSQHSGRWRVTGTLKRSQVDTFLFAVCRYDPPLDLSQDTGLVLRVETPANQPSAPQLLVIVTDRHGVQYWTETGRSLGVPGKSELILPLNTFAHAPFSQGPAGPFDWKGVAAINVGWGGHYGQEGDRIEFVMAVPEAMRFRSSRAAVRSSR